MLIEYYFDFTCPYAYLGSTQIENLARHHGAEFQWRPVLLGGLFRAISTPMNLAASQPRDKTAMLHRDLQRWADRYRVPFRFASRHPMRSVRALRALLACPPSAWSACIAALFRTYWVEDLNIEEEATLRRALERAGLEPEQIERCLVANDDPEFKAELRARSDRALELGAFGVPGLRVSGDELGEPLFLWGQDRMGMLEAVLEGWRPALEHPYEPETGSGGDIAAQHSRPGEEERGLDFYFDFSSPFAYLASTQVQALAARCGATLRYRPLLLGAIFKELGTDNVPFLAMPEVKRDYTSRELAMWASVWQVPFRFNSTFPLRTVTALRLVLQESDKQEELIHRLFRAAWVESIDIGDPERLRELLVELELPADEMLAACAEPTVKTRLFEATAEARRHEVYGVPTLIARRGEVAEPFWGQDRLELVESFFERDEPLVTRVPDEL